MTELNTTISKDASVIGALLSNSILEGSGKPPSRDAQKTNKDILDTSKPKDGLSRPVEAKLNKKKLDKALDRTGTPQIDGSFNPDGPDSKGIDYKIRHQEIKKQQDFFHEYLDKGFDSNAITDDQRKSAREWVQKIMVEDPRFAEYAADLKRNGKDTKAYYNDILKDQRFKELIRQHIDASTNTWIDNDEMKILNAQNEVVQKQQDRANKQIAFDRAQEASKINKKFIEENYELDGITPKGDLEEYNKTKSVDDAEYESIQNELALAAIKVRDAEALFIKNKNQATYLDAKKEYNDLSKKLEESSSAKRKRLEERLKSAKNQQQILEDAERTAKQALDNADIVVRNAEIKLKKTQIDRDEAEQAYLDALNGAVQEATQEWLDEKIDDMSGLYDQKLEQQQREAEEKLETDKEDNKAKFELAYSTSKLTRWGEKKKRGLFGREKYRYKKTEIDSDYNSFLTDGAEEATFRIVREDALKANIIISGASQEEFYKALKDNGIDAKELQGKLAAQIMQRKMATGGIPRDEAAHILETEWGLSAIQEGLKLNKEFREAMKNLDEQSVIKKGILGRARDVLKAKPFLLGALFLLAAGLMQVGNQVVEGGNVQH